MTLDDVYGSDFDRFPLEQEAKGWELQFAPGKFRLTWEDADAARRARAENRGLSPIS